MIQGIGNNESAWARSLSMHGRAILAIQSAVAYEEVWESGSCARTTGRAQQIGREKMVFLQDLWVSFKLARLARRIYRSFGKMDVVIGTSTYYALTGLLMKQAGMASRCVSFLQDYFPYDRGPLPARIWRWYHYRFSRFVARRADEVWCVSPRIRTGNANPRHFVIPVWIDDNRSSPDGRTDMAYVGGPIEDHCLPWLFEICARNKIRLHVAGASAYLDSIRHLAPPDAVFYGFVHEREKLAEILSKCFCGYAVYRDTGPTNYAYYGVPSKIYTYLAHNVPVVTTDITDWSKHVRDDRLGRLVEPDRDQVESAILEILANYRTYSDSINSFRDQWNRGVEQFLDERMNALIENKEQ